MVLELEIPVYLPRLHRSQRKVVQEARRFNVVCCGRRWGKTTLGIDRLIATAISGKPAGWFGPTYKMLSEAWRIVKTRLSPITKNLLVQEHRIELLTGGVIEMWSLDRPDAARGRAYARAVIDEAAVVRDLEDAWNAVIRPSLTDHAGDAWFLSTPKGMNYFHSLFLRAQSEADWMSWRLPTSENPFIKREEIEAARASLPERIFMQEYCADFIAGDSGVFRRVREAAIAIPQERALPGHQYVIGVDWAKYSDWTVFAVLDVTERSLVYLDRSNKVNYIAQAGRLRALYERFQPVLIIAERNAMGEPVLEQLEREGLPILPFTTTTGTKNAIIDALSLAFERGDLRILDDSELIAELQAFSAERLPSGLFRYAAPSGMHDDCVMALAFAWYGAQHAGPNTSAVTAIVHERKKPTAYLFART